MQFEHQFLLINFDGTKHLISTFSNKESGVKGEVLKQIIEERTGIPTNQQRITRLSTSSPINDNTEILLPPSSNSEKEGEEIAIFELKLRIEGGKGGFGSLLRGGPAGVVQKKTTNFNACRDLSGRRIRHVNQEKRLSEAAKKKKEKTTNKDRDNDDDEKKKKNERKEKHRFNEEEFNSEVLILTSSVSNAVEESFQLHGKRKRVTPTVKSIKLLKLDDDDDDDDDDPHSEVNDNQSDSSSFVDQNNDVKQIDKSPISVPAHDDDDDDGIKIEEVKKDELNNASSSSSSLQNESSNEMASKRELNDFHSAEEMQQLGLEKLKDELQKRGLLCGGTLEQRAHRLFSIMNLDRSQWPSSVFPSSKKKNNKKKNKKKENNNNK